jgi:hypothetical protein
MVTIQNLNKPDMGQIKSPNITCQQGPNTDRILVSNGSYVAGFTLRKA